MHADNHLLKTEDRLDDRARAGLSVLGRWSRIGCPPTSCGARSGYF
ncbi:MAG: hypothetical protein ACLRSW_05335 [Christensenellaceae bacterium]